jgi:dipeptidyl-peptidase-4
VKPKIEMQMFVNLKNIDLLKKIWYFCGFYVISHSNLIAQEITVEKIWKNYEFYPKGIDGFKSMNDGEHYTMVTEDLSIYKFPIAKKNNRGELLMDGRLLTYEGMQLIIDDYEFNSDESKILLATNLKSIYRYSFEATYFFFDLKTKKLKPLDSVNHPQTLAEYSPDGKMVSYIHNNNLYIKDLETEKVIQLTKDGKKNEIINGTSDWVYEEEFSITKAYDWSSDSKLIAFLRFDERKVKEFALTIYGSLYPDYYPFKYPKAGEDNSKVSAHVVDIKSGEMVHLNLSNYEYIPRLNWTPSTNNLIVQTLNRHQNELNYHLFDFNDSQHNYKLIFKERSNTYIDVDNDLVILKDGKHIIRTSDQDGFNHIYKLGFDGSTTQITKGNWDVIDFLGIDENLNLIYFSSSEPSATQKSIYSIRLDGSNKKILTKNSGYNEVEFLKGMKYFTLSYSNANQPPIYSLCKNDGSVIRILESNEDLLNNIDSYPISKKEFLTIDANGIQLNAWMIKPLNFDPSRKYPVYMTVYGGPGHNEVLDSWDGSDYMYHQLLAQKGYIIFSVDPRGTMYRGSDFKKSTYLQLGKLEIEDIINSAKELQKLKYVDPDRIGIMGWSFGGFLSSLAITKGSDVFKMAIAVAPVTNWRFYDNIYTERFMRTPNENKEGYDNNSPIHFANKLKGKFLLIHGSADDNVHYQNTMEMISAMVDANKQFDLFIYPNKNHGIYGGNTRNHLFQLMLDYTLKNL